MPAFRATFSDLKLVKTRQVAQLIFEVPIEHFDGAYEILGGVPVPGKERWFGIAAIKSPADEDREAPRATTGGSSKRDWRDLPGSQQAAIRVGEPTFAAYLREEHPDEWHETGDADACLKLMCSIQSKRELVTNHKALVLWHQIDSAYQAWKAVEHA